MRTGLDRLAWRRRGPPLPAVSLVMLLGALVLALIGGLASALGAVLLVGVIAAVAVGVGIMLFPRAHVLLGMVFALVITGVLEFFFYFGQANWLSSVLVASMMIPAVMGMLGISGRGEGFTAFGVIIGSYVVSLCVASLINRVPTAQVIVGVRNYFPYIGVALLLVHGRFEIGFVRKLVRVLLVIAVIQVPVAIYQHLVIGPARVAIRGAVGREDEAIVGTFGGSIVTGGYTGEMAAFLVMTLVFVIALWRERLLNGWLAALMAPFLLVPVLLAETKIALILLPVLAFVAFGSDIRKSPSAALLSIFGATVLMAAVGGVYAYKYWHSSGDAMQQLLYSFDPNFMVTPDHRGRVGTVVHWFQSNVVAGRYSAALMGHGLASSLEGSSTIGYGTAVLKYGLGLDAHGMSRLLWDGGVFALMVFMLLCARTIFVASKLRKDPSADAKDRAGLTYSLVAMVAMLLMLPYQMSVLGGSAMQFLFWFNVGYVEYMRRWRAKEAGQVSSGRASVRSGLETRATSKLHEAV